MKRTPRLSKSGIDYLTHCWNFYSGCLNKKLGVCQVENCWAESITKRMSHNYPNGFEPTFYPEAVLSPMSLRKPAIIGCAFMGDLFLDCIDPNMKVPVALYGELPDHRFIDLLKIGINPIPGFPLKEAIYSTIRCCSQHTFLFKTKCPWNLVKWSPFPDNCWPGVTATDTRMALEACLYLGDIEAKVRYLSLEPMLHSINIPPEHLKVCKIGLVIIGAQTNPYRPPTIEAVEGIVGACGKAGTKVFLKDNLWPLFDGSHYSVPLWAFDKDSRLRQELSSV